MISPGRLWLSGVMAGVATLAIMLATEPRLAIVWDEGYTLGREERLRQWFRALRNPPEFAAAWQPPAMQLVQQVGAPPPRADQVNTRSKLLLDRDVLAYFWPFAREEPHGHPPFYALLGLTGDLIAPGWAVLPRARLGPILLFSLSAGVIFAFALSRWGLWPAMASASAWVLQPNLFGHGHYAAYDAVLTSLWALAVIAFTTACGGVADRRSWARWLSAIGFGVAVGCALATKLTGWFLPLPFLLWTLWQRDRAGTRVLLLGLPTAVAVLFLLNPPWWTEPLTGPIRFFQSNLTRGQTIPIEVQFLGTIYKTPGEWLPWYNTLVWTAMVTPVGFLALSLCGVVQAWRQRYGDPFCLLILMNWLFLLGLRALPRTPGHDGVRLFLPAFGMLALMVGPGARRVLDRFGPRARAVVALAGVEGLVSVVLMMPVPLSYYSPIVGGLPGAVRLGMEPTYYWDALTEPALEWLRANTGPGQSIRFATFPTSWLYLRETGALPRKLYPIDPGRPAWYVMQNRPGAWSPADRQLVARGTPALTIRKLGVPLVWIFPNSQQAAAP
jgi:hypothetical protein